MSAYEDMLKKDGGGIIAPSREDSLAETRKSFRRAEDMEEEQDPLPMAPHAERMQLADEVAANSADAPGAPGEGATAVLPGTVYVPVAIMIAGMRVTLPEAKRWPFEGGHGEILELHSGDGAATMVPESDSRFDILESGSRTPCLCVGSSTTPTGVFISVIYDTPATP